MNKSFLKYILFAAVALAVVSSCATRRKLMNLVNASDSTATVQLALAKEADYLPEMKNDLSASRDTLTVKDDDGREFLLMKAVKDEETGEMVATEVIEAAKVTARFRNVAERHGKVDLAFQIMVPPSMMDTKWQLRFYPDMFVMGDSLRLEPVIITGGDYRKAQLRGYELYDKFLAKIVQDTTKFIDIEQLEIFLQRNIPQLYAFKSDSSYVDESQFNTVYGVSQRQAVEHYTNKVARRINERRKNKREAMYAKYVKVPIVTEGIRLDSVVVNTDGDFVYYYVQTINTRPKLRKVDVKLSGEIFESDKRIYTIPVTEPLTFYISSISAFVDNTEKYLTKVIERRATANTECRIDFEAGKSEIKMDYADNAYEINMISKTIASLLENKDFDLDSIIVRATASPEGRFTLNSSLAQKRSEAVSSYFSKYIEAYKDSLRQEAGFSMSFNGEEQKIVAAEKPVDIRFTPRCIPENWDDLDALVDKDVVMNPDQKSDYFNVRSESNPDVREARMKNQAYYRYMKETLYPKLRTVKFNCYLHRKGMIKDTVHTTVLDSTYMRGVQELRDMNYAEALALLIPYDDFNTAVAYVGMDRNVNAMRILSKLEKTAQVNYLMAILYSRSGDFNNAVQHYVTSCRQNPSYRFRGNLDPEISVLIKQYGLNSEENDRIFD
ncbi:MAG: hypothetical protein SPK38_03075 [Candidatus Cryptobacteroides sp.]|nr:hypothetical protein [Candidatus Cryptobacteroides sp.]